MKKPSPTTPLEPTWDENEVLRRMLNTPPRHKAAARPQKKLPGKEPRRPHQTEKPPLP